MSGQTDRDLSAASLSMLYVRVVFFLTVVTAFHSASYEHMIMLLKVMYSRKIANENNSPERQQMSNVSLPPLSICRRILTTK